MRFIDRIFKGRKPRRLDKLAGALLNLSFTANAPLDQRITFGRTTNATVTNSQGLVQYAPHNLLTHSEQFDNAAWLKTNTTVTANAIAAPDGTLTADTLVSSAGTGVIQRVQRTNTDTTNIQTYSVYLKYAGVQYITIGFSNSGSVNATFDVFNGVLSYAPAGGGMSAKITAVGNGWFRCEYTGLITGSVLAINFSTDGPWNLNNTTFVGNGTSGIYIWGAQLEQGSTATTYNPTTVKNLLGYTEHFDNAAWNKSNAFVQTNLLTYSQDFDNAAWITVGNSAGTRPAKGTTTGTRPDGTIGIVNTIVFPAVGSGQYGFFYQNTTSSLLNITATGSIYVRVTSGTATIFLNIEDSLAAPSIGNFGASAAQTVTTEWTRISVTGTRTTTFGNASLILGFDTRASATQTNAAPITVEIWGAQLVQGTSAGDYKATYASAAAVGYPDIYGQPFAQKLVESVTTVASHDVRLFGVVSGANSTISVYAKAGERTVMKLYSQGVVGSYYFDLANGVVSEWTTGSGAVIQSVGNGWYRCSIPIVNALISGQISALIGTAIDAIGNHIGDGTSGIYIFGAQISDSASVDPYVYQPVAAPVSTAYYGPRFDYDPVTLAPKGLLIEEQRTNLLTYSEQFDNAVWAKNTSIITATNGVDPSGGNTAARWVSNAGSTTHYLGQVYTNSPGTTFTYSGWVRSATGSDQACTVFVGSTTNAGNLTATNEWQRFSVTGSAAFVGPLLCGFSRGSGNAPVDLWVWGAQLEVGAFATSYIPTAASQVTRAADTASMIGNNFARWYRQDEGTLFGESQILQGAPNNRLYFLGDGTVNNYLTVGLSVSGKVGSIFTNAVDQTDSFPTVSATSGVYYKQALAYTNNDAASSRDGLPVNTDNLVKLPIVNFMGLGFLVTGANLGSGTIKRIAYYNRRLSNTELQGITQ